MTRVSFDRAKGYVSVIQTTDSNLLHDVAQACIKAGIVTDGDLRRHIDDVDLLRRTVREVMTAHPRTIRAGALAAEAVHVMNEKSITSLFVLEDGKPVGIVRLHDCLKAGVA